ncbi:Helix-turn-helix XRE-family like protein [Chromobacterium vaccinii]|nr:Helix-turn-helix XRE-family like protein [Chromobacterium vaccinii]QND89792.1 Helix-turn-helix XRE-family like protein [Chromobacterium vaccinii]
MNIRVIRRATGLNQHDFWSALGVTQSGGSRYESGRNIPKPVLALIVAVYVHKIDLSKLNEDNAPVIRAVLAGELDGKKLLKTAEDMRRISAAAAGVAVEAANASGQVQGIAA